MSNDKEKSISVDADNSVKENAENHDKSKRKALKTVAGGTVAAGAILSHKQWVDPVIKTVVLPAHAQMSEDMEDDDTAGDPMEEDVTIELACSDVSTTGSSNVPAFNDIQLTAGLTVTATLLTGPADTDLSGIPFTLTIDDELTRFDTSDRSMPLPPPTAFGPISNGPTVINGMTGAGGEFIYTDLTDGLLYDGTQFPPPISAGLSSYSVAASVTLTLSSTDARVTSTGTACSCTKTKGQPSTALACTPAAVVN